MSTTSGNPVSGLGVDPVTVRLEDNCQLVTSAQNFWQFTGTLNIYLGDQCSISGTGGLFYAPTTGTINLYYQGAGSTITSSMMFNYGAPAVVFNNYIVADAVPLLTFVNYAGTPAFFFETAAANLAPYTGSGTFPLPASNPNVTIGTMYFDQTSGQPWWWNGSAWVTVNAGVPGVELLTATAGSSQGTPVGNLSLGVQVSILVNATGAAAFWHLPDGTDGMIKEIVSGGNLGSALISNAFIGVTSTNNAYGTSDILDLNGSGYSVRLVWSTAGGGWVAVSTCSNASAQWD
jgi:hypothetical protein